MSQSAGASAPTIFTFRTTEVRTVVVDGNPWFVASDIAKALNFRDAANMTRVLDDDERGTHIMSTPSGDQEMIVINESGMYHAVLKSRKPEAKPFRKWVTAEVLPAIRKTGRYEGTPYSVQPGQTLSAEQADTLRQMLTEGVQKLPAKQQPGAMIQGWSKLKAHFGVPYREIPAGEFNEAISLIARHLAGGQPLKRLPHKNLAAEHFYASVRIEFSTIKTPNAARQAVMIGEQIFREMGIHGPSALTEENVGEAVRLLRAWLNLYR